MCTSCETLAAELVCFCDYPLAVLCTGQCLEKHRKKTGFHFETPVHNLPNVTKEDFSAYQAWVFGLKRAQLEVIKNIARIDVFEEEVVAAFDHIENEIGDMKRACQAAIQTLRQTISEMINTAVGETTAQAFNSDPQFTTYLSHWIWWGANPNNKADLQFYRSSTHIGDREAIFELISIEMKPLMTFLPELPPDLVPTPKSTLDVSNTPGLVSTLFVLSDLLVPESAGDSTVIPEGAKSQSTPSAEQPLSAQTAYGDRAGYVKETGLLIDSVHSHPSTQEIAHPELREEAKEELTTSRFQQSKSTSGSDQLPAELFVNRRSASGSVTRRTSCAVCNAEYTAEDKEYFCPGACRCRLCTIQGLTGELSQCKLCSKEVSIEIIKLVNKGRCRCEICGVVVEIRDLEAKSRCKICRQCVILLPEGKGHCRLHPYAAFEITPAHYEDLQQMMNGCTWACCANATYQDPTLQLQCGHYMCKVHKRDLKYCRCCKAAARKQ